MGRRFRRAVPNYSAFQAIARGVASKWATWYKITLQNREGIMMPLAPLSRKFSKTRPLLLLVLITPLLMGTSFPAVPLEESADLMMYLVPDQDYALHITMPVDRTIQGKVVQLDKGDISPPAIVHPANSFTAPLRKGAPERLYLKKFPDREAYYVIGRGSSLPPTPTVSAVIHNGWLLPSHSFRPGETLIAEVRIAVPAPLLEKYQSVDVYVSTLLPNGEYASWVTDGWPQLNLLMDSAPIPWKKNVLLENTQVLPNFYHRFSDEAPAGSYLIHALLVFPGTDPLDPDNWISASTVPFKLAPAPTISQDIR